MEPAYDRLGVTYTRHRRPDPRIAAQVAAALGGAARVVNVGAGAGSYEPADRRVVAVEPSTVMIRQRPAGAAPVVRGVAEALPFPDASFDAGMAMLTTHWWPDAAAGVAELRRVAPARQVVLTWDADRTAGFWLVADYFPQVAARERALPTLHAVLALLPGAAVEVVPVPHDCEDGFLGAYWRRPDAYLDAGVRASFSALDFLGLEVVGAALTRLERDLGSGAWQQRHGHLLELDEIDLGYRLVIGGSSPGRSPSG